MGNNNANPDPRFRVGQKVRVNFDRYTEWRRTMKLPSNKQIAEKAIALATSLNSTILSTEVLLTLAHTGQPSARRKNESEAKVTAPRLIRAKGRLYRRIENDHD